jgi:hypothetical protein
MHRHLPASPDPPPSATGRSPRDRPGASSDPVRCLSRTVYRVCPKGVFHAVRTFLTSLKAPRAVRHVIPREVTRPGRRSGGRHARRAGASARPDTHRDRTGSSALAPCGARRAAAPARERPSSRRPSLEPSKITVKSAAACGLRVLRMALRATLDCDLAWLTSAPVGWMARSGKPQLVAYGNRLNIAVPLAKASSTWSPKGQRAGQ